MTPPTYTVVFDVETGGVEPHHPTISLGAVVLDDATLVEVAAFDQKIKFVVAECDPEALKVNGYAPEAWKDAVTPDQAAQRFAAFIRPYCSVQMISKRTGKPFNVAKLAGYNAVSFDLPRLKALFGAGFFPCSYLVRDLLQRAIFFFDERPYDLAPENFKLSTVCAHFGIETDGAHDALADARMSAALMVTFKREAVLLGGW